MSIKWLLGFRKYEWHGRQTPASINQLFINIIHPVLFILNKICIFSLPCKYLLHNKYCNTINPSVSLFPCWETVSAMLYAEKIFQTSAHTLTVIFLSCVITSKDCLFRFLPGKERHWHPRSSALPIGLWIFAQMKAPPRIVLVRKSLT